VTRRSGYAAVIRFLLVGGSSALLNLFLLWVFASLCGLWYPAASVAGYTVAAAYNFLLQRSWAFAGRGGNLFAQLPQFAVVNLAGLLVNTTIFCLLIADTGTPYLMAQAIASLAVALLSFFAYRRVFAPPDVVVSAELA
jgi:putative flippase GtrA